MVPTGVEGVIPLMQQSMYPLRKVLPGQLQEPLHDRTLDDNYRLKYLWGCFIIIIIYFTDMVNSRMEAG
jgi:hypothetical protein